MSDTKIGNTGLSIHNDKFSGIYRGTVMDNVDPSQLGRVKVQIYPMLAGIETANLPWAVPMYPITDGAGAGIGYFAVPDIGTNVFVMFEQGDIYQPVYIGEAPDGVKGLPTSRITNYPNRKVIKFSSGIEVYIDDTTIEIKVVHPTGSYIKVDNTGDVKVHCNRDAIISAVRNVEIDGVNLTFNITGDTIATINGDVDLTATGDIDFTGATVSINP